MPEYKVSVVIVNYNVKDLLLTCLHSLFQFHENHSRFQIIVVDNASTDGSCEAIRAEFPQVILIENADNAGFPKANNQGFQLSEGEYIFMLNPDTEFIDDAIEKLADFMDNNEVEIVAPSLLNTDRSHQQSVWRFPSVASVFCELFYLKFFIRRKHYSDKNLNLVLEAESFSGAAIFFRKSVLKEIGNLDETMFWIEDVDFCYRAHHQQLKLVYNPEIKIVHHIGQSAKKNYNISISNQMYNKIKFFRKHHSGFSSGLITFLSFLNVLFKIAVFGLLSPFDITYKRKASAYVYTLKRIFNPPMGIA